MKNNYKIPTLELPFMPLMFIFFVFCTFFIYFFFKAFGWSGWPGLIVMGIIWFLILFVIVKYFQTRNEGLIINDSGLFLSFNGQEVHFDWEEVKKIGFQAILTPKSFGVAEAIPYLAVELKDSSSISVLKSSREFGFLQKKNDLVLYVDQKDVLDLYISLKSASERDSDLSAYLSTKTLLVEKLNNLSKK